MYIKYRHSESPQVQEFILHQRLKQEIAKNVGNKCRYVESELHFKNKQISSNCTPLSEPSRFSQSVRSNQLQATSNLIKNNSSSNIRPSNHPLILRTSGSERDLRFLNHFPTVANTTNYNNNNNFNNNNHNSSSNGNNRQFNDHVVVNTNNNDFKQLNKPKKINDHECGGCQIREMNQNLANMQKLVQEQHHQMTKLREKCLRSYFERLHPSHSSSSK